MVGELRVVHFGHGPADAFGILGRMHKEIREIVRELQKRGYTVAIGGKHLKVKDDQGHTVYTLPTSPGGGRWRQNLLSDLRRKGLL